jgi:quinol monooxygenase YgiN
MLDRRETMGGAIALGLLGSIGVRANMTGNSMYGLIGKMKAAPGGRAELIGILTEGTGTMPGNLAYIVAEDLVDEDGIWITEVWADKEAHTASLKLPSVQQAIARGRSLIAGFEDRHELRPIGIAGLAAQ